MAWRASARPSWVMFRYLRIAPTRNADEINAAKQEMSREDIEPWGTKKRDRLAMYSQQLVEVDDRLQSADLTPGQEVRFRSLLAKLLHQLAEGKGELPSSAQLELDLKSNPFLLSDTLVQDADGNLYPVRK
jgi:hypothetical protein